MGAVLHDAAWALPMTPRSQEQFQLLTAEIAKLDGASLLREVRLAVDGQDDAVLRMLLAQTTPAYSDITLEGE